MSISTHEIDRRRCRAHRGNGEPCSAYAIRGGVVCAVHGGRAPQVKRAADERLRELVDPAIVELERLMTKSDMDSVRLAAVKDILDRAGLKPTEKIDARVLGAFTLRIDRGDADSE